MPVSRRFQANVPFPMGQLHPQLSTHVLPRLLDALAVANGAHCRKISVAPQHVSQSRRNQNLECNSGAFGGTMSVPSPTTQHRARNKRFRIEAATVRAGIVLLAQLVLCGNALAATEYAVDGLAVGTQLGFGSASYREYKCNPSDQFEGLIGLASRPSGWRRATSS